MQLHLARIVLAAALTLVYISAEAFHPVDGWWWNPDQSGRGFQIEMQDDEMFVAAFHFQPDGQPVWWVGNGRYDDATGLMSGLFDRYENGQCPGCPYPGEPDIIPGAGSEFTIEFHNAISATVHWDNESIDIQRMYWRFNPAEPNSFLYGEFHFTYGALGVYFGDQIRLFESFDSNGQEFIGGQVAGASSDRLAVARFDPDLGLFIILVDSSTNYYRYFVFDMTKDRLEGRVWTFEKDDEPTGDGLAFIGHRVASRAYVQTGIGPHSTEPDKPASTALAEERDRLLATALSGPATATDVSVGTPNGSHSIASDQLHQAFSLLRDQLAQGTGAE